MQALLRSAVTQAFCKMQFRVHLRSWLLWFCWRPSMRALQVPAQALCRLKAKAAQSAASLSHLPGTLREVQIEEIVSRESTRFSYAKQEFAAIPLSANRSQTLASLCCIGLQPLAAIGVSKSEKHRALDTVLFQKKYKRQSRARA